MKMENLFQAQPPAWKFQTWWAGAPSAAAPPRVPVCEVEEDPAVGKTVL